MLVNTILFHAKLPTPKSSAALLTCCQDVQYYQEYKIVSILYGIQITKIKLLPRFHHWVHNCKTAHANFLCPNHKSSGGKSHLNL